jgi:hypothetical protein
MAMILAAGMAYIVVGMGLIVLGNGLYSILSGLARANGNRTNQDGQA